MKYLVILLLISMAIFIVVSMIFKFLGRIFSFFNPPKENINMKDKNKNEEVLYKKDNIVVMRGEAKNKGEEK